MAIAVCRLRLAAAGLALCLFAYSAPSAQSKAIRCGSLIDGVSETARSDVAIVVDGRRIAAVGAFESVAPAGAEVIDLRPATCLPGLIDAHAHILIDTEDYQVDHLERSSAYKALRGLRVARRLLGAGWTTLRVVGDGVDAVRRAVRQEVKFGSGWIKVLASGAMMSAGDDPRRAHFSAEELGALIEEADRLGVPVAAHAHSTEGIRQAVLAGVRSIEHGTFLDDEVIGLMADRGVFLVPTLYVFEPGVMDESPTAKDLEVDALLRGTRASRFRNLAQAFRAGVKIGVGTDYVGFPVEEGAREFALLAEAGLTPMEAIRAGTRVNAELLGWQDRVGRIEAGMLADIIAVPGDPLADLGVLSRVSFVMKDGAVVRRD